MTPDKVVHLSYVGKRPGVASFFGAVTRRNYRFGLGQTTGDVHADDAPALLALNGIDRFEKV